MPERIVILASGSGTLLQALLDAVAAGDLDVDVAVVGSDVSGAQAIARAETAGVATFVLPPADFRDRESWNEALLAALEAAQPEWIVCAGFMRILGPAVVDAFPGRIVNTHPALLPAFPGAHGVRDALRYGVKVTGCTVHLVDHGVDTGPILAQQAVEVREDDDEASLHERIKVVERMLLVRTLASLTGGTR
ncbi:MAG TPA: phosphoribosylglycinamide formyltransferase [Actinobacteria bacterium]|nr:phosphoribosylglycinamide formyltransferase [Actinomycetota bacterium]